MRSFKAVKTNANNYYNLLILQVNNATARNSKKIDYIYCQAKSAGTNSFPSSISSSSDVPSPAQINLNFSPDVYEDIFLPFFRKQPRGLSPYFTQFSSVNA